MSTAPARVAPPAAVPGTRRERLRRRVRTLSVRDRILIAVLLGIPLLADLVFIWFPAVSSVLLSFTSWRGLGTLADIKWAGLANYQFAVSVDPEFWPSVLHNIIWLLVFGLIATPLGMLFAVLIDRGLKGGRIYQSVLFLPVMLSLALIGIIWELIYAPNLGLVNSILGRTSNADAIDWLGNSNLNLWAVLVEASWRQAGYVMVLYLAGLKAFDPSLREAAEMDGANAWQTFIRVVFPVMKPINIIILVVTVIESLRAYDLVYITGHGAVIPGLGLLSMLVTQNIVGQTQRIGYGSALATVLVIISIVPICVFLYQAFRREDRKT